MPTTVPFVIISAMCARESSFIVFSLMLLHIIAFLKGPGSLRQMPFSRARAAARETSFSYSPYSRSSSAFVASSAAGRISSMDCMASTPLR